MRQITVYGIPNCDSVKKAVNWLRQNEASFSFHDFKKSGISHKKLLEWCKKSAWQVILNKKSQSWRSLSLSDQEKSNNQTAAINVMLKNPLLIKRPVIEIDTNLLIGFDEQQLTAMVHL